MSKLHASLYTTILLLPAFAAVVVRYRRALAARFARFAVFGVVYSKVFYQEAYTAVSPRRLVVEGLRQ